MDRGPAEGAACAGPGGWTVMVGFPAVGASVVLARPARPVSRSFDPKDGRALAIDGLAGSKSVAEWRGVTRSGRFEPFAAIMRVSVLDAAQRQATIDDGRLPAAPSRTPVLVVFRLGPEGSCVVAYVDAQANASANELAREAADTTARTTPCPVDHVAILGRTSPILDGYLR